MLGPMTYGVLSIPTEAAFDPSDIDGMQLWLKADAGTLQSTGGAAAASDNDPVGEWQDQSGNGNHVTQVIADSKPALKLNILNGLPVIRFDGSDDNLKKTFSSALSQPNTVFIVVRFATIASVRVTLDGVGGSNRHYFGYSLNQSAWELFAGSSVYRGTPDTSYHYHAIQYNGASSFLRTDGAQQGAVGNMGAHTLAGITVGNANSGTSVVLNGDIAEVILYDAALSTAEMEQVESYLASRYF